MNAVFANVPFTQYKHVFKFDMSARSPGNRYHPDVTESPAKVSAVDFYQSVASNGTR